jgi:hypothetical protein
LQFLRKENEAARKAVREDSDATRNMLKHALWLVAVPITILISVASFLGWHSVSDLKSSIQAEAKHQTEAEVSRMQVEIRKSLADQFQTEHLQQLVRSAARDETVIAARPLIQKEVASQVSAGVQGDRGMIQKAVITSTNSAVTKMSPRIEALVKDAVDGEVSSRVNPVVEKVKSLQEEEQISLLISRANADDGVSFDTLLRLLNGLIGPADQQRKQSVTLALQSILRSHDLGGIYLTRSFASPPDADQLSTFLLSPDTSTRQAALDTYSNQPKNPTVENKVINMALSDPSLTVRTASYRVLNGWEKQKFIALDGWGLSQWLATRPTASTK